MNRNSTQELAKPLRRLAIIEQFPPNSLQSSHLHNGSVPIRRSRTFRLIVTRMTPITSLTGDRGTSIRQVIESRVPAETTITGVTRGDGWLGIWSRFRAEMTITSITRRDVWMGIRSRFRAGMTVTSVTRGDVWLGIPSMELFRGRSGRGD